MVMENAEIKIIEQLRQGDERSYKYLYDNYYVFLCCVANSYVKDHFTAETIVGDTIFHIWEVRETLDISISLRAYLARSVRNRCINYVTSEYERHEVEISALNNENLLDDETFATVGSPLEDIFGEELRDKIEVSIEQLPSECKTVFKKSRFEEKKYVEIAQELGISPSTVKYHIKNALLAIQADIEKYLLIFLLIYFS